MAFVLAAEQPPVYSNYNDSAFVLAAEQPPVCSNYNDRLLYWLPSSLLFVEQPPVCNVQFVKN